MREYNAYVKIKELFEGQKDSDLFEALYFYMISYMKNDLMGMSFMLDELYDLIGFRDHKSVLYLIENIEV